MKAEEIITGILIIACLGYLTLETCCSDSKECTSTITTEEKECTSGKKIEEEVTHSHGDMEHSHIGGGEEHDHEEVTHSHADMEHSHIGGGEEHDHEGEVVVE